MRARPLTARELAFRWLPRNASLNALPWAAALTGNGLFHRERWQFCLQSRAFAHVLDAPCLADPSPGEWYALLRGSTIVFLGDSLLRDNLWFLIATLIAATTGPGFSVNGTLGKDQFGAVNPGMTRVHHPSATNLRYTVSDSDGVSTTLHWCHYADSRFCLRGPEMIAADLHVLSHGSWDLNGEMEPTKAPEMAPSLAPLVKAAVAAGRPPIFMEYTATHFPWGDGEFEDGLNYRIPPAPTRGRCCNQSDDAAGCRVSPLPLCSARNCMPLSACASSRSAARLAIREAYAAAGAVVLPMWDASVSLFDSHRGPAPSALKGVDCRHWCSPGSMGVAWQRRIYTMLQDEGARARTSQQACEQGDGDGEQQEQQASQPASPPPPLPPRRHRRFNLWPSQPPPSPPLPPPSPPPPPARNKKARSSRGTPGRGEICDSKG